MDPTGATTPEPIISPGQRVSTDMQRIPEPELMEEVDQAEAYAQADFSEANTLFLRLVQERQPGDLVGARALDLGCGNADIVVRFLEAYPQAECDAVDGSAAMLDQARMALENNPALAQRWRLIQERLPSDTLPERHYDLVLSNSLLHHLHDPQVLWQTIQRAGRPGAIVVVMDLMRPASPAQAESLVETYASDAPEVLRRDFRNSLFAAFEPAEVTSQLREAGLHGLDVGVVSDHHLATFGRLD